MLHSTAEQTRRYTERATQQRIAAALATLATSERGSSDPKQSRADAERGKTLRK
jgi:hypothetical protein